MLTHANDVEDSKAAEHYFQDLEKANEASSGSITMQCEIASDDAPEFERATFRGFVRGRQTVAKFNERAANELDVFLAVFRVPDVDADVLVTLCVPVRIAPDSSSAESVWFVLRFGFVVNSTVSYIVNAGDAYSR